MDNDTIISFEDKPGMRELVIGEAAHDPAEDHEIDRQVFHLRLANSRREREAASLLLKKMYGWRGYDVDPHAVHGPNRITLYAESGGATVGTMSLCLDEAGLGLPADENFRHELDHLRGQGRRLCEPSRLAIDKGASRRVFAGLIHISYLYAHHIHGYTDYVIEVNPRHVMFYRRMLDFSPCGTQRTCSRVGAPAVLLRLDLSHMAEQIRLYGGMMEQHGGVRSFYPYFFPASDEAGITARLMRGQP